MNILGFLGCPVHCDLEHVTSPLGLSVPICLRVTDKPRAPLQAMPQQLLGFLPSQYSTQASEMLGSLSLPRNYVLWREGAPTLKTLPSASPITTLVSPHCWTGNPRSRQQVLFH